LVAQWRRGGAPGVDAVNHWAGQAATLARRAPAGEIARDLWERAQPLLGG
jgi:nitronate monooxygenase